MHDSHIPCDEPWVPDDTALACCAEQQDTRVPNERGWVLSLDWADPNQHLFTACEDAVINLADLAHRCTSGTHYVSEKSRFALDALDELRQELQYATDCVVMGTTGTTVLHNPDNPACTAVYRFGTPQDDYLTSLTAIHHQGFAISLYLDPSNGTISLAQVREIARKLSLAFDPSDVADLLRCFDDAMLQLGIEPLEDTFAPLEADVAG